MKLLAQTIQKLELELKKSLIHRRDPRSGNTDILKMYLQTKK